ncbi:type I-F CRISPR-associated protein Csy2 [Endozoicomonas ascidiicola]|uniref:type I-F CRISPR-associated protein Csy2 n=1 Tax=Endozoicomonas ascidiicola TaxID=1698521 RepID=UPI0008372116|nr:type I-F CRISPR-associated protein Csy2 [Endozoicomonas ascidiicola]
MKVLGDLLEVEEKTEFNEAVKRAFFSDVPVEIDGHVREALIILTNLTRSSADKTDLDDEAAAKELLKNDQWHADIIVTTPWVTTHYLKDPNSRATGCVRWFTDDYGEDGEKYLGWSHNANKVSRSHFLATEFFWNNRVTSLFEAFSQQVNSQLIDELITLGLPVDKAQQLQELCRGGMDSCLPDSVSTESKVLLFPDGQGEYVAVTPLVAAGVQRWVHNLVGNPDVMSRPVFYTRPFLVSSFLATCKGKLYCFHYPPKLGTRDRKLDYLLDQWRFKKHLLNVRCVFQKKNLAFLLDCSLGKVVVESEKQGKDRLQKQAVGVKSIAEELFSLLCRLRAYYPSRCNQISQMLDETTELDVIRGSISNVNEAVEYFLSQLNDIFEQSQYSVQLAYHPRLMRLFEKGIKETLIKITEPVKSTDTVGQFLHFKRLLAYDVNARSNPYVIGLPALTAWAGLVHAFLCNLGYESRQTDFRFAIVLRKYSLNKGHPLPVQEIKNGRISNAPIIDRKSCDLEFDLIVQLPESAKEIDLSEDNLFGCMPSRFAGGTLTNPIEGTYGKCDFYRCCEIYSSLDDLSSSLIQLPSYARIISSVCESPGKHELVGLLSEGKVLPIGSGFRFLGAPTVREGIEGYLHAFAYSDMSVIRLSSVHILNPLDRGFWSMNYSDSGIAISVEQQTHGTKSETE